MKRLILIALLIVVPAPAALAGAFYDGIVAYNTGDYAGAMRHWRPLAERDDGKAQSGLGFLYYKGLGVKRDLDRAARWFWSAAEKDVPEAQMFLGMMYFFGEGVARDYPLAHMLTDLAVGAGHEEAIEVREVIARSMTRAEIEKAWRHVTLWYADRTGR